MHLCVLLIESLVEVGLFGWPNKETRAVSGLRLDFKAKTRFWLGATQCMKSMKVLTGVGNTNLCVSEKE